MTSHFDEDAYDSNFEKEYDVPKGEESEKTFERRKFLKETVFTVVGITLFLVWFLGRAVLVARVEVERSMKKKEQERSTQVFRESLEAEARQTGLSVDEVIDKRIREKAEEPEEGKTRWEKTIQKHIKQYLEKKD